MKSVLISIVFVVVEISVQLENKLSDAGVKNDTNQVCSAQLRQNKLGCCVYLGEQAVKLKSVLLFMHLLV